MLPGDPVSAESVADPVAAETQEVWKQSTVGQMAARLLGAFEDLLYPHPDEVPPQGSVTSILLELVERLPSQRLDEVAAMWCPSREELDAIYPLVDCLEAWGHPLEPSVVAALAAWCEVEGTKSDLTPLRPSLYTLEVLMTALRIPFHAIKLVASRDSARLVTLSPQGMLIRDEDGELGFYQGEGEAPHGTVALVRVPMLTRLGEAEVRLFVELGNSVMVCYQSDLDQRRCWLRCTPGDDIRSSFVDGIRTWHFRGNVFAELRSAADGAGDTRSPAIWEDHRASLHFMRPGEIPDQMTESDRVLHLPPVADLPARFDEVGPEALLVDPAGVYPEATRLDRMHAAVSAITRTAQPTRMLEETWTTLLRERLQTSAVVRNAFMRAVDIGTMEHLATFVGGDYALEIFAPLHAALELESMHDFAAMALMYELCISEDTTSRSFPKSYKPNLIRAALRNHLLELIQEGDAETRAAACRLLATAPCMAAASERAVVDYELKLRLEDPDAGVAEQATVALAQSALRDEFALPSLYRIHKVVRAEAATNDGARRRRLQETAREITAVQKRLSGAPRTSKESSSTADALAGLVLDIREAMEASPLTQGRVALMAPSAIDDLIERVRRHMADYADDRGWTLDDLHQDMLEKGVANWFTFVARREVSDARFSCDEDEERDVESFSCSKVCAPRPLWIEAQGRINPFFTSLLRRFTEGGLNGVRVARLALGARTVTRLPAMLYLQMFDPVRRQFVGLIDEVLGRTSGIERQIWDLIGAVIPRVDQADTAPRTPEVKAAPAVEVVATPVTVPIDIADESALVLERAGRLLAAFSLPEPCLLQVVYLVHDSGLASLGVTRPTAAPQVARQKVGAATALRSTSARPNSTLAV